MVSPRFTLLRDLAAGFLHLLYPRLCVACQSEIPSGEDCFCLKCRLKLQASDMYRQPDNEFTRRFWGRLPLQAGAAQYYFTRKSAIQKALHALKYRNQPDIGLQLGRRFGRLLTTAPGFSEVQLIVPVPLHPLRERLRGYNQSQMFGQGLAETMQVPIAPRALARRRHTHTQTRKKRLDRFDNMQSIFYVQEPAVLQGKHVLLVDDILTTGATLEMCALATLEVPGVRLSMATVAIAMI
jgi:ComF family protein